MVLRRAQRCVLCANKLGWSHFVVGMSRPSSSSIDPMPPTEPSTSTDGAVPIPVEQHVIAFSNAPRQSVIGFVASVPHDIDLLSPPSTINRDDLQRENEVEMDCVSFYESSSIDAAAPTNANGLAGAGWLARAGWRWLAGAIHLDKQIVRNPVGKATMSELKLTARTRSRHPPGP